MIISFCGKSETGKVRPHNEDSLLILTYSTNGWTASPHGKVNTQEMGAVFAVADGMGGDNAGEVAAALAIKTIHEEFLKVPKAPGEVDAIQKMLEQTVMKAHVAIVDLASKEKGTE